MKKFKMESRVEVIEVMGVEGEVAPVFGVAVRFEGTESMDEVIFEGCDGDVAGLAEVFVGAPDAGELHDVVAVMVYGQTSSRARRR
jgi:hypothetical protein